MTEPKPPDAPQWALVFALLPIRERVESSARDDRTPSCVRLLASERIGIRVLGSRLHGYICGSNLDRLLARVDSVANPAERNLRIFLCER